MMKVSRAELWFAVPIAVVLLIVVMAVRDFGVLPSPQDRIAPASVPGSALAALAVLTEAACLYLILRPRTYGRSWRRAVLALVIFSCWTVVNTPAIVIEGVPLLSLHFFWLLLVEMFLLVLTGRSGLAAFFADLETDPRRVV